jgi:HAD superfamily hydrolase (TIGR01509 family)
MKPALATIPAGIDTLLLDLDGTLLDLAFDNRFWGQVVPEAYGAKHGLSIQQALDDIMPRLASVEGTLPWYCLDHWSRTLDMDLSTLKTEHAGLVAWLPGAQDFLLRQRAAGRRLVLATNSHPETLRIKVQQTRVTDFLDAAYSSHPFGAPKEDPRFWDGLKAVESFDPRRTAFIDDNARVLRAARAAGIACLIAVTRPDTTLPDKTPPAEFPHVRAVADL